MTVVGINGSPRKGKNSDTMLDFALKGARDKGASTEKINLFNLNFSGCVSCFECKRLGGKSFGKCAVQDDLSEVLNKILNADAVVISVPIYFSDVPGAVRNMLERLWFPGLLYSKDGKKAYTKSVKVGLIYTMNVKDGSIYKNLFELHKNVFEMLLGETCMICAEDTLQFDDYSKYSSSKFNEEDKKMRNEFEFPHDCERAYILGQMLVG